MTAIEDPDESGRGDEILAGEFALGVLDREGRAAAADRLERDGVFRALVERWESEFSGFNSAYASVAPPAFVLARIDDRLFSETALARVSSLSAIWNSLALWRGLAFAAVAGLVALAVFGNPVSDFGPAAQQGAALVAELAADGSPMTLVARYDAAAGALRLTPVAATASEPRALELWVIDGTNPPVSLGLLPAGGDGVIAIPPAERGRIAAGATLAISLEPEGGSPTGQPTGPVVAAGAVRAI